MVSSRDRENFRLKTCSSTTNDSTHTATESASPTSLSEFKFSVSLKLNLKLDLGFILRFQSDMQQALSERFTASPLSTVQRPPSTATLMLNCKREPTGDADSGVDMSVTTALTTISSSSPTTSSNGMDSHSDEDAVLPAPSGTILNSQSVEFILPIPQPVPDDLNNQFMCETASRLLFLSVNWIKNINYLAQRPIPLGITMKAKWCDIFVLGLIQCAPDFNLLPMLLTLNTQFEAFSRFGKLFFSTLNTI